MNNRTLPWVVSIVLAMLLVWAWSSRAGQVDDAVTRALQAEDSVLALEPLVDSLFAEANRRDTVLVEVTDTLIEVVERVRVEALSISDSVLAHVDSVGAMHLAELRQLHTEEVAALEALADERLVWGETWREAALAQALEVEQLRARGDEWERAFNSTQSQNRRLKIGGAALAALAVFVLVR